MQTLAGRYVLEERLGSGGTATVWRATDSRLGVARAVKVLDVAPGPEREALRERLRNEARAMARVSHPNVVAVHDVGEDGERDFIVMDLVEGPSLAQRLDEGGPIDPDEAVRVAVQVLQALGAAHKQGLVHRDVKPGNILLSPDGDAHLCDFGIALATASEQRHTKTGAALGSLPYMAPEQRRDARSVGPEADLYAVGCTLYHALTCATPVDLYLAPGRSPRWTAVPENLVPVLRTATAAEPGDRYATADAMARALLRVGSAADPVEPTLDFDPETVEQVRAGSERRTRTGRYVWVNLGVLVLSLLVAGFLVFRMQQMVAEGLEARSQARPAIAVDPSVPIVGLWQGPWDGASPGARVRLEGPDDRRTGEMRIQLGEVERRSVVDGSFDRRSARLVLDDRHEQPGSGRYEAVLDRSGALRGHFRRAGGGDPIPFLLVRIE